MGLPMSGSGSAPAPCDPSQTAAAMRDANGDIAAAQKRNDRIRR